MARLADPGPARSHRHRVRSPRPCRGPSSRRRRRRHAGQRLRYVDLDRGRSPWPLGWWRRCRQGHQGRRPAPQWRRVGHRLGRGGRHRCGGHTGQHVLQVPRTGHDAAPCRRAGPDRHPHLRVPRLRRATSPSPPSSAARAPASHRTEGQAPCSSRASPSCATSPAGSTARTAVGSSGIGTGLDDPIDETLAAIVRGMEVDTVPPTPC